MSCCGKLRAALRQPASNDGEPIRPRFAPRAVEFEYSGHQQLAVTGPATGVVYRFRGHGARLTVHGADAPSFVSVPGLKPAR